MDFVITQSHANRRHMEAMERRRDRMDQMANPVRKLSYDDKKRMYQRVYKSITKDLLEDITNGNVNEGIKNDEEYVIGCEMLKEIIKFCLVKVSSKYKLTGLQYEAFLKWIPTLLPLVYGVGYYSSNIEQLHKLLGTNHKKLVFLLIGARRDGKSVFQAIALSAIFLHCTGNPFMVPLLGPGEGTGMRMIVTIGSILNLQSVIEEYGRTYKWNVSQKKITVYNRNDKKERKIIEAKAPTDSAMRGWTAKYNAGDEFFNFPIKFTQAHVWARQIEAIGTLLITNPNPGEPYYSERLTKSSDVIEVLNKSRVCADCIENQRDNFDTPLGLQNYCESKGHVEPPDVPWVDSEMVKKWSKYMDNDVYAREANIGIFSNESKFVKNKLISQFFAQRSSCTKFKYFALGCDPSDCGNSMTGISIFGIEIGYTGNSCYHLLNVEEFLMRQELDLKKIVVGIQKRFYQKMLNLGYKKTSKTKCYNWIEFFMHHGYGINEMYKKDFELSKCCKVMKAIKWARRDKKFEKYGISKTSEITESYVKFMSRLMNTNRLKIHEGFFTSHKNGNNYILRELQTQMRNLRRDPPVREGGQGKITAKTTNSNDDILVSFFMVPYNMERSMRPNLHGDEMSDDERNRNACLNKQLYFDTEKPTFTYF